MDSIKCPVCGLVNFAGSETCRRCEAGLFFQPAPAPEPITPPQHGGVRGFWQWVLWVCGAAATILLAAYASLVLTSDGLTREETAVVMDAIAVLERADFTREAGLLRRYTIFRGSDNWWNRYVGHASAYAATNFPFEVVTLYPPFFKAPIDDVERAAILLHESHHLFGQQEDEALQRVWVEKRQLGWTAASYSHTRVWKNTREWTAAAAPRLFTCGGDGESDCVD